MKERVKGTPIPPKGRLDHWVERVRPGERLHVVILSDAIFGLEAHWSGTRTIPCVGKDAGCRGCLGNNPVRWKGGCHVYDLSRRESYFIELTPASARFLVAMIGPSSELRGLKVDLFRSGTARNGRLLVELKGRFEGMKRLPPAQDPEPVLKWLWLH